jgi:signal transduction histidine kinase
MNKTLVNIQKVFKKYSNFKIALESVCPLIANEFNADRIMILKEEVDDSGKHSHLTTFHQWSDTGIPHRVHGVSKIEGVTLNFSFKDYATTLAIDKPFVYQDRAAGKVLSDELRSFYKDSDIRTLVTLPLFIGNSIWGALSVEFVKEEVPASDELVVQLTIIANIIASAITCSKYNLATANTIVDDHSRRMVELGRMAAGIAHEINNPVFIIGGYLTRLEGILIDHEEEYDEESIKRCINQIQNNCKRITDIIEGLRMISRDSSKDSFEVVDINSVLEKVVDVSLDRFKKSMVEIGLSMCEKECLVECRPGQISQVITNLINNSFDSISKSKDLDKWVKVESSLQGDQVILSVIDSGAKLSPQLVENVMEPFFTTKQRGEGTGLGLSISREIVRKFGGDLKIDTNHDTVKFDIILPLISFEEE